MKPWRSLNRRRRRAAARAEIAPRPQLIKWQCEDVPAMRGAFSDALRSGLLQITSGLRLGGKLIWENPIRQSDLSFRGYPADPRAVVGPFVFDVAEKYAEPEALCQDCLRPQPAHPSNEGECATCSGETCSCSGCLDTLRRLRAGELRADVLGLRGGDLAEWTEAGGGVAADRADFIAWKGATIYLQDAQGVWFDAGHYATPAPPPRRYPSERALIVYDEAAPIDWEAVKRAFEDAGPEGGQA